MRPQHFFLRENFFATKKMKRLSDDDIRHWQCKKSWNAVPPWVIRDYVEYQHWVEITWIDLSKNWILKQRPLYTLRKIPIEVVRETKNSIETVIIDSQIVLIFYPD